MPNLIDIPVVVSTLVTFFTMDGTEAAIEALKGLTVNGVLKLSELKDELLGQSEVKQSLEHFQQNPLDSAAKSGLEGVLQQALEKHSVFQQTTVQVQGDVIAKAGGVAAAVISGHVTMTNSGRVDD